MAQQSKIKQKEMPLEPWEFDDELKNDHEQLPRSFPSHLEVCQAASYPRAKMSLGTIDQPSSYKQRRKKYSVDYVKKNQEDLRSYSLIGSNYVNFLNENPERFVPINAHGSANSYIRQPVINTTYIGYYDEYPFVFDSFKRLKKQKDFECKIRPKTTDHNKSSNRKLSPKPIKANSSQVVEQAWGKQSRNMGNHLQKVLRIKEKLRQKLKKNSEKKDQQRGSYAKETIKINESRESSVNVRSTEKRGDKWKQYMAMQQRQREIKRSKAACKTFFAVVGGAISR